MKKSISCAVICAAAFGAGVLICPAPASGTAHDITAISRQAGAPEQNGLVREDGYCRYYEDGQPVTEEWITDGSQTYYFGKDGNAAVQKCRIDGDYYVFSQEGWLVQPSSRKIVRVESADGTIKKYYTDTDGKALSGWSDDKNFYFDKTGEMATGITVLNGRFFYFNAGGRYNTEKTAKIRKAAKYEAPFANLKKYIGKPVRTQYQSSCYGKGKDGILSYNGYTVYTFKPDSGAEIFMGAE